MKKTQPKIISISDLIQWNDNGEIELSPKYQRNRVWNDTAKSYLIDTIIRGLPIPPIFLRQKVDVNTRRTFREVVDGQQRIRAILEFVADNYAIKRSHNKDYGDHKYSELDPEVQEEILQYEILAETIVEKDESVIYDMFARLNSNNMVLNRQEIRNSKFWGEFKVLVYKLASSYRDFFLSNKLISDVECARMKDAELVTSMLLLLSEGIISETPNSIDNFYRKYDQKFLDGDIIEQQFRSTMDVIMHIYSYLGGACGCFFNKNYFFTLYGVTINQMYGIKGANLPRNNRYDENNLQGNISSYINAIVGFLSDFETNLDDKDNLFGRYAEYMEFSKYHSFRTTSKSERLSRITFLNKAIGSAQNDHE